MNRVSCLVLFSHFRSVLPCLFHVFFPNLTFFNPLSNNTLPITGTHSIETDFEQDNSTNFMEEVERSIALDPNAEPELVIDSLRVSSDGIPSIGSRDLHKISQNTAIKMYDAILSSNLPSGSYSAERYLFFMYIYDEMRTTDPISLSLMEYEEMTYSETSLESSSDDSSGDSSTVMVTAFVASGALILIIVGVLIVWHVRKNLLKANKGRDGLLGDIITKNKRTCSRIRRFSLPSSLAIFTHTFRAPCLSF